jgi:geranylgeranyl diphosphate synthase type II
VAQAYATEVTRHSRTVQPSVSEYLEECRALVLEEMTGFVPARSLYGAVLYDLMLDYPLREAKALRPALCIATCRALGGALEGVLKSATVLEFYHNAFLIHDDVEDGSEKRRDRPTLHRAHGASVAINVGDAMLALALEPLLDNMRLLGLGKALRILRAIARMARESAEGQALELAWVKRGDFGVSDRDYLRMVHQKTSHYTFIAPIVIGAMIAGADELTLFRFTRFATALGLAFQIQDDILNLDSDEAEYGKELLGDLWEGKHTLIVMHALRRATASERRRALTVLRKRRPPHVADRQSLEALVAELERSGDVTARAARRLANFGVEATTKTEADVQFLRKLITRYRSIDYARGLAERRARRAQKSLAELSRGLAPSVHLGFLNDIAAFVIERER